MTDTPKHAAHVRRETGIEPTSADARDPGLPQESGRELMLDDRAIQPEVIPARRPFVQKLHDFAENRNPYNPPERLYTDRRSEEVVRLDGSVLNRPLRMTRGPRIALTASLVVALGLGGAFLFQCGDAILNSDEREQESLQENLSREVPLQLPILKDLIQLDDDSIRSSFEQAGMTIVDLPVSGNEESGGFDIVKLPEGVDVADASSAILMWSGTGSVSASEAARILNGSWRLMVDRGEYVNMNVRYADLTNTDETAALQAAVSAEGLDGTATSEITIDSAGNTIQTGTFEVDGTIYNWQVSVCPLNAVYSIEGIPSTAMYVGVRAYQA